MTKKFTQEEVAQYFKEQGYKLLSEYKDSSTKVKVCNKNGEEYDVILSSFRSGRRPERRSVKFTQEEVSQYFKENGYILLSEYTGIGDKVKVQHIASGTVYTTRFGDFKRGHRPVLKHNKYADSAVSKSKGRRSKYTQNEVVEYLNSIGYTLIGPYINTYTKLTLVSKTDGNTYTSTSLAGIKSGHRPERVRARSKTLPYVKKEVEKYGYTLLRYDNSKNITLLTPNGYEWNTSFSNFKAGSRHPLEINGYSKGESIIYSILTKDNINFNFQHRVKICGSTHIFDFILPDNNTIIEYDGEQHYKGRGIYGRRLKYTRIRDRVKDDWAKSNGYGMVRVPYTIKKPKDIVEYLKTYIPEISLFDSEYAYYQSVHTDNVTTNDILTYYMKHTIKETCAKYDINQVYLTNLFKTTYSKSKKSFIKDKAVEYYLTHSLEDTLMKYNISASTIQTTFKNMWGMSKREYLNK